ncbi:hypothetical protein B7P43_G10341 [Cryptotermes secundus]|uniref:Uncharacterized protein n=1 Tax=Cryptotermes secundus TaxID=105785 RepID=A0A2J7PZF2_9NEOP|nr:hypothetical protein B7P43_G10341 [Cryptotermes secundus]
MLDRSKGKGTGKKKPLFSRFGDWASGYQPHLGKQHTVTCRQTRGRDFYGNATIDRYRGNNNCSIVILTGVSMVITEGSLPNSGQGYR